MIVPWKQTPEQKWLIEHYPMRPDNPCLSMNDDQFHAYIHTRRQEFEEKYAGKTNTQIADMQTSRRLIANARTITLQ